jgi:hypothetical protein
LTQQGSYSDSARVALIVQVVIASLLAAAWVAIMPSTASADSFAGHVRIHHTSCCGQQVAVFKAFGQSEVAYRVCLIRPSGERKCRIMRTGAAGSPSRATFINAGVGVHRVIWKVGGRLVDSDRYVVVVEQDFRRRLPARAEEVRTDA